MKKFRLPRVPVRPAAQKFGLRTIALFEAGKGLLVLLVGLGFFWLIHHRVQEKAAEVIGYLHLNPAGRTSGILLDFAHAVSDARIGLLAIGSLLYTAFRWVEAYGLWYQRHWAQWLGALSGAAYVPIELYELCRGFSWLKFTVLCVNLAIVAYLIYSMIPTGCDPKLRARTMRPGIRGRRGRSGTSAAGAVR